jgi:hypothetical protein
MFTEKMRGPAPSATLVTTGRVTGYVLRFNKKSDDRSGKGNIVATGKATDEVWGVVFRIGDAEMEALDISEVGYKPIPIDVVTADGTTKARTYVAKTQRIDNSLKPYTWYKDFVVRGAQDHGLPQAYIARLEAVEVIDDPNKEREQTNLAVLARGSAH